MENDNRKGFYFRQYQAPDISPFDKLFEIFKELITHTSGDFDEAIDWLRELDKEYKLTDASYTIDDFIEDLKKKGYIRDELKDDALQALALPPKPSAPFASRHWTRFSATSNEAETAITKPNMPETAMSIRENSVSSILAMAWNASP